MINVRPIAETEDSVTIRRADYDALLEELEDALDRALLRKVEADVAAGRDEFIPMALADRLFEGENPVRVWREHRGLSGQALADAAAVAPSYLSEIETGKKPGSFDAMARIARVLSVGMEDLRRAEE